MAVRNTKGLEVFVEKHPSTPITKDGTNGGTTLTGIADNAGAADLTVDAVAGIAAGDVVTFKNTGFPELDGNSFVVTAATGTTITVNADISASTGTFDAVNAEATILPMGQMQKICLSSIGINADTPSSVGVGTFCDPSATVAGASAGAGTLDFGGYLDTEDAGFVLMEELADISDPKSVVIKFPGTGGHLIMVGTLSSFNFTDIPLDGAVAYNAQFTLSSKPQHRF